MQGRQNSSEDRMQLVMQRHLFPQGCGYRSETGGLMKELRDITVDQSKWSMSSKVAFFAFILNWNQISLFSSRLP
jgi:Zn-dependent M16 (insulinase) family peptidase